jgi:hypothetical protein
MTQSLPIIPPEQIEVDPPTEEIPDQQQLNQYW